jgi:hypothetical protein
LQQELDSFYRDMTTETYGQLEPIIRPATADVYLKIIRQALGWALRIGLPAQHQHQHHAGNCAALPEGATPNHTPNHNHSYEPTPNPVSLNSLIKSSAPGSAEQAFDYVQFLRIDRNASAAYQANVIRAFIRLAKFMFRSEAAAHDNADMLGGGSGHASVDKPFDRLGIVKALRKLHRSSFKTASKESKVHGICFCF